MTRELKQRAFLGLFCALACSALSMSAATVLLPFGSGWSYFDFGTSPGPDWTSPAYIENGWKPGFAQFGYGDGDEDTIVSYGPDDEAKYITTYFRTHLQVADPSQFGVLTLNLTRDDGAIFISMGTKSSAATCLRALFQNPLLH